MVKGVIQGLAAQYAVGEGSCFTVQNMIFYSQLADTLFGRLFAPPISRLLIATGGRDAFVVTQLAFVIAMTVALLLVVSPVDRLARTIT